jgi:hypothetical protein
MRQTTTAEVRLDGGKQRVPAPRAHAARHFCCQTAGCYRISLRRRRDDGKIIPTEPGIWGMSVYVFFTRIATRPTEFFRIPPDQVVELGAEVEI